MDDKNEVIKNYLYSSSEKDEEEKKNNNKFIFII